MCPQQGVVVCQYLKALANEDILLRTHCCRRKCFPVCPRAQHLLRSHILCPGTKNVSDFVQKHFVSATNVSQFAQHKKHHEQQCVRNNVSSFASTLRPLLVSLQCFELVSLRCLKLYYHYSEKLISINMSRYSSFPNCLFNPVISSLEDRHSAYKPTFKALTKLYKPRACKRKFTVHNAWLA